MIHISFYLARLSSAVSSMAEIRSTLDQTIVESRVESSPNNNFKKDELQGKMQSPLRLLEATLTGGEE